MTNTKLMCPQEKNNANAASVSFTAETGSLDTFNNQVAGVGT